MISTSECCLKPFGFIVLSVLFISILVPPGCKPADPGATEDTAAAQQPDTLPADFVAFFDRFHNDTAFQLAHINFPLEGLPNATGTEDTVIGEKYFWQRADWKIHHPFTDPSHQFDNWYKVLNDRIIEHWIRMKGTNLFLQRRFAKLDDGWYLIYYAAMRPRKIESIDLPEETPAVRPTEK